MPTTHVADNQPEAAVPRQRRAMAMAAVLLAVAVGPACKATSPAVPVEQRDEPAADDSELASTSRALSAQCQLLGTALDNGVINIKKLGAIGDGLSHPVTSKYSATAAAQMFPTLKSPNWATDEIDWAALQTAVDLASQCAPSTPDASKMLAVEIPLGAYILNRTVAIAPPSLSETRHGFLVYGAAAQSSNLRWSGSASAGALDLINIGSARLRDFKVSNHGANYGAWGIRLRSVNGQAVCCSHLTNLTISGFQEGLIVGNDPYQSGSSPSQCTYQGLRIEGGKYAVHLKGADTDGQHFFNLNTRDITDAVILSEIGRNVHVTGGVDFGTAAGTQNRSYLRITGSASGGGYSLRNLRIESGVGLIWAGAGSPTNLAGGNGSLASLPQESTPLMVEVDNVVVADPHVALEPSTPTQSVGPTRIVHWATRGTLRIANSVFPQDNPNFYFHKVENAQLIEFILEGSQLNVHEPEYHATPADPLALVQTSTQAVGAGKVGGLRVALRGNLRLERSKVGTTTTSGKTRYMTFEVAGRLRDQVRHYTDEDVAQKNYTLVVDDRATPQEAARIHLGAGWGGGAQVQDVRGSDRALSFSVLAKAAGLPLQPNPTVIIEFADGTYSKPPRTMSKLDLVHGADPKCAGQFHPTSDDPVADAAEITLGGTPMDGCIYRFTVLTQP